MAAPRALARFSIIPQFSGPFIPLPADTTNSASGKGISPSGRLTEITFINAAPASPLISSTGQFEPLSSAGILLGKRDIIFTADFT